MKEDEGDEEACWRLKAKEEKEEKGGEGGGTTSKGGSRLYIFVSQSPTWEGPSPLTQNDRPTLSLYNKHPALSLLSCVQHYSLMSCLQSSHFPSFHGSLFSLRLIEQL